MRFLRRAHEEGSATKILVFVVATALQDASRLKVFSRVDLLLQC